MSDTVLKVITQLVAALASLFLNAFLLQMGWAYVIVPLFQLTAISFLQALWSVLLINIVTGRTRSQFESENS